MSELPIIVTLALGFTGVIFFVLNQNRRFNDIDRRLERIENKLDNHEPLIRGR